MPSFVEVLVNGFSIILKQVKQPQIGMRPAWLMSAETSSAWRWETKRQYQTHQERKGLPENRAGPKDSFGGVLPTSRRFFPAWSFGYFWIKPKVTASAAI